MSFREDWAIAGPSVQTIANETSQALKLTWGNEI